MKNKKSGGYSFLDFLYDIIRWFIIITGLPIFRPKYIYENEAAKKHVKGGALLVSNHVHLVDPMYLMLGIWYRRNHFIIAEEVYNKKFLSIFLKISGCLPVNRENVSLDTFRNIVDRLKQGRMVTIFAEGHINTDESKIDAFKSGMVLMALQSGVPIVPIYMKKKKHFYSRIVFVIGEKIDIDDGSGKRPGLAKINKIAEQVHERELQLKEIGDS
ncbi:MAG: 1-acyl-sn-glycerol-3-phosphate acyltransferase [Lachnospiraceae bacterium]|nr:1-acyl-sn-glycerol-3-phosphate acyltransferase [Lachnospiraceae bacterium]